MDIQIREYTKEDTKEAIRIWNHIVEEGNAFPQMDCLTESTGEEFFLGQSYTGIAVDVDRGEIAGNASYAVRWDLRGCQIGEKLVRHCMEQGKALGYGILQFNAVVKSNEAALHLYQKLGFTRLGVIPRGFLMKDGSFEDIIPHYIAL